MARIAFFTGILLLLYATQFVDSTKLNYPRVLLPIFSKISVNFTLEVIEKGCFKWTSSRQDLILITPLYDDNDLECSNKATVTVLTRERRRNTAIVLAEDLTTGDALRCDVILDVIDKLGVHTTTRQLYLEEAPEIFELRAEDSQGNAFTTLEGIEFNWGITSSNGRSGTKGWSPALRFMSFSESPYYEVPPALEKFEANNVKGYMVLLEGINTGTAKVMVSLAYAEYEYVPAIEVIITVLANIILEPSDVRILIGDTVSFRVLQLKMGKLHEISLNNQYYLEIEDNQIASISGKDIKGNHLGRTTVVLRDRNVNDASDNGRISASELRATAPSAHVTVVDPVKIGLSLLPHNNWVTVEGERHEIAIDLYTEDDQKITMGSRYSVGSEFNEELFLMLKRSQNNSRIYGEAVRAGSTPVYGSFKKLSAQAELQIFSELTLTPAKVILPYDPNAVKTQKIQFVATGGDGSFIWHSQNTRYLHINQDGLAATVIRDTDSSKYYMDHLHEDGTVLTSHSSVRVALTRNPKIWRQAEIYFLPPVKMEIVLYNFETALKDFVRLHIAIYGYVNGSYVPFTRCENILFDLEFTNQIFQVDYNTNTEQMVGAACQVLHLRSTAIGLTNLRISYKFQDKILKDEITLSVFEKLSLMKPEENIVILPIGASRNVIYAGGPQKIFTLASELTKSTKYDGKIAKISEVHFDSRASMHVFNVLCRKVGSTSITYSVYNMLSTENFFRYESSIVTAVHCVKPRFLNLYATERLRTSCPLTMKNSLLHLNNRNEKFEIEIEVQDAKNRRLMNISSLHIDWEFAAGDERYHSIAHQRRTEDELYEGVRLPSRDILVSTLTEVMPNFRIKGVVTRYDSAVLSKYSIQPEDPHFGILNSKTGVVAKPVIENEIRFMAVNSTMFAKHHISIFMARNRQERVPISQGSGYFDLQLTEDDIVNVEIDSKRRELIVSPLRIGHTRLELIDRCLDTDSSELSISVVTIGRIRVEVPDRVERTKSIVAIVRLYDSNENVLHVDSDQLHIYELSQDIYNTDILSLQLGDQTGLEEGEIRYLVTGNNLGETKIVFNSGSGDSLISSEPVNIQVFPPLRLYPRNSTLVVGSSIQIYYQGGPQPDVNIVYHVHDAKVISMESAIVTASKLGESKITGQCVMVDRRTGEKVIISEDSIEVHVVPLLNIQIKTPLVRIRSGSVMPAAVWGLPNLSPMVLGTLENMKVTWSSNQPDVVDIFNIFADAGIEYDETNLISVRIKALNPGKTRIEALVTLPSGQRLSSFVDVVVFKTLELESPEHIRRDWILMAPRSTIHLKANLDNVIFKRDANDSKGIIHVTSDGVVRSRDTIGRDLVIAKTLEQTLPISIEVKNVQYILASLAYPTIKFKHSEDRIPRGMNFVLQVSLHDNLGNKFSHNIDDLNAIKYELSHKDIVDVQIGNNLTVAVSLPRETSNMIAISLRDTTGVKHAEDYIKLSVADSKHIYPTKTIFSVGDIICFDSPLTLSSMWTSSDQRIVSIDKHTGVARVNDNRLKLSEKVVVSNGDQATGSFIKYDVEVREADVIEFANVFEIFSGTAYRAHLVIRNHFQVSKQENLIAQNISKCISTLENMPVKLFTCKLKSEQSLGAQLIDFYKVTPIFEPQTGRYACQVDLLVPFIEVLQIVKTNDVLFELEAHLKNGLTDSITLKFVPGIRVAPDTIYTADSKEHMVTITGLDKVLLKVEVKSSHPKELQVSQMSKSHGTLLYQVKVLKDEPFTAPVYVDIYSAETAQNIQVPVLSSYEMLQTCEDSKDRRGFMNVLLYLGMTITALMFIGALFYLSFHWYPGRAQVVNEEGPSPFSGRKKIYECVYKAFSPVRRNRVNASTNCPVRTRTISPCSRVAYSPDLRRYVDLSNPGDYLDMSSGNETPVYGDTSLISPQKRVNRRFL